MSEFLTIGEAMVLFGGCDEDKALKDTYNYQKFLAGAEVNVCVGVARLGHLAAYVTRLGADPFGQFIKEDIEKNGIDTSYIDFTDLFWTGFMMKNRVTNGDPDIYYWRKNSAAANFEASLLDKIDFSKLKFAHLSGIFPAISDQALGAFRHLVTLLNEHDVPTTFDPNLRPQLWSSTEHMVATINELAKQATIILPGENEGEILVGSRDPEIIADFYLDQGVKTEYVIVKLGEKGAFVKQKGEKGYYVDGFKVEKVVDTVGAGDGFAAGLITALMEGKSMESAVLRANAIGAFAVQSPGDNDGYPLVEELEDFYLKNNVQE